MKPISIITQKTLGASTSNVPVLPEPDFEPPALAQHRVLRMVEPARAERIVGGHNTAAAEEHNTVAGGIAPARQGTDTEAVRWRMSAVGQRKPSLALGFGYASRCIR